MPDSGSVASLLARRRKQCQLRRNRADPAGGVVRRGRSRACEGVLPLEELERSGRESDADTGGTGAVEAETARADAGGMPAPGFHRELPHAERETARTRPLDRPHALPRRADRLSDFHLRPAWPERDRNGSADCRRAPRRVDPGHAAANSVTNEASPERERLRG